MSKNPWNRARMHALGALLVPLVGSGCVVPTHRSAEPLTPEEREVLRQSIARIDRERLERGEAEPVAVTPRDLSSELLPLPEPEAAPETAVVRGARPQRQGRGPDGAGAARGAASGVPVSRSADRQAPGPGDEPNAATPSTGPIPRPAAPATTFGGLQGEVVVSGSRADAPLVVLAIPIGRDLEPSKETSTLTRGAQGFEPAFLVVPTGETVRFQNDDDLCHSFFSSSSNHEFQLGILDPQASTTYRVEQPGTLQVYCSLHSGKQVSIFAVPTPHFAVVAEDGTYDLGRLEAGEYRVMLWSNGDVLHRHELEVGPGTRSLWNVGAQPLGPTSEAR